MKGVLSEKNGGPYECLRQCGLVSLFKYLSPGGTIPQYATKNFQTILTYRGVNGEDIPLRDSEDVMDVLEKACAEHLMDDNDDTIIEIYCSFTNKKSDRVKKLRSKATAAADSVMNTLKNWVDGASSRVNRVKDRARNEDYVMVNDHEEQKPHSPGEWASRFVHFLYQPEKGRDYPEKSSLKENAFDGIKNSLDSFALDVVEGVAIVFGLIDETITAHEVAHASRCVNEWNKANNFDRDYEFHEDKDDEMMEFEFDLEETKEYVVCDTKSMEEAESLSLDEPSLEDAVVISAPVADDVISISDEDTLGIDNCDVSGSDDDSWAMMDDDDF